MELISAKLSDIPIKTSDNVPTNFAALMNDYDSGCLGTDQKLFILKNSNKEVLCYLSYAHEVRPDIFVYGDDNEDPGPLGNVVSVVILVALFIGVFLTPIILRRRS